jgi:CelD/BcsL family acetyltransferase involved in cellulose biosynthesis
VDLSKSLNVSLLKANLLCSEARPLEGLPQGHSYTLEEFAGPEAFHKLRNDWERLWRSSSEATDTQTWQWQYLYWKHLAPKTKPVIVVARDPAGVCVALAPFFICRDEASWITKGAFLGDKRPDYQLILALPELPSVVGSQVLNHFISKVNKRVPFIELSNIPLLSYSGGVVDRLFPKRFDEASTVTRWERETYAVPLPTTLDDYQKQLGPRSRRDFSYDRRRLSKEFKVEFRAYDSPENLDNALDDIETIDRARWGTASRYNVSAHRSFERSLAHALCDLGIYRAFVLYLDGKPSAFVSGAIVRSTLKVASIGFDRSVAANLSVGKLSNFFAIEHCIHHGLTEYDLTRGGEEYKKLLGATPRINLHIRLYRSRFDRFIESHAKEMVSFLHRQNWLRRFYQSVIRR